MEDALVSLDDSVLATVQGGTEAVWSPDFKFGGTGPTVDEARADFVRQCQARGHSPGACQAARLDVVGAVNYNPALNKHNVVTPFRKPRPGYGAD